MLKKCIVLLLKEGKPNVYVRTVKPGIGSGLYGGSLTLLNATSLEFKTLSGMSFCGSHLTLELTSLPLML